MSTRGGAGQARSASPTLVAAAVGAVFTLAVAALPFARFAFRAPDLHLVVETAVGLVAALLAYLLLGRWRQGGRLADLLLAVGLGLLAVTGLLADVGGRLADLEPVATWVALLVRTVTAGLLAVAGSLPAATPATRPARTWLGAVLVATGVGVVTLVLARDSLPVPLDPSLSPEQSGRPLVTGHPVLLALQAAQVVGYAIATVGFARRALREPDDELTRWLAPSVAMATWARVDYLLFPSIYSEWVYAGDLLRVVSYALLLVGAAREIRRGQEQQTRLALVEERRRVARDLHDGVVQELGLIRTEAVRLGAADVVAAADRALDEARDAVDLLGRPADEPLARSLARVAEEMARRHGVRVDHELAADLAAPPSVREALVRILREALANAARHSGACTVLVRGVSAGGHHRVEVVDAGRGFDPGAVTGGFGLVSMRDRAAAADLVLEISSRPGGGTTVTLGWSA